MSQKKQTKKDLQSQITDKLYVIFDELKTSTKSDKVKRSLRKASKALAKGLKAASKNKEAEKARLAKKEAKGKSQKKIKLLSESSTVPADIHNN